MNDRLEGLRASLEARGLACILVNKIENVRYLSGFSGSSAALVVTVDRAVLVTDGRYSEQAEREAPGWELQVHTGPLAAAAAGAVPGVACAFEVSCSYDFFRRLKEAAPDATFEPVEGMVEDLRVRKDAGEVGLIAASLECAAWAFSSTRDELAPGATERELAAVIDYRMMLAGADGPAFDTVVASGPNSSLPHSPLTDRALSDGDLVVIDFGALRSGYRSDSTRTMVVGEPGGREAGMYAAVRGALDAALEKLEPGVKASDVDAAARSHIERAGFGAQFTHSLGHGVGIETHERPTVSWVSTETVEPGMVFTVEPGIYVPGFGGVRIEEMVHMTETGPEVLSRGIPVADQ